MMSIHTLHCIVLWSGILRKIALYDMALPNQKYKIQEAEPQIKLRHGNLILWSVFNTPDHERALPNQKDKTQGIEPQIKLRHKNLIFILVFNISDDERAFPNQKDKLQEVGPQMELRHENLILLPLFNIFDDERSHFALRCDLSQQIACRCVI